MDRRVEAAGADLARLESMAFGTVSVEELLGHFREVHNIVSRHADAIESRLVFFGYVAPEVEEEEEGADLGDLDVPGNGLLGGSSSVLSVDDDQKILEEAEEPTPPQTETYEQDDNAFQGMIRASKEEYDKLPPYMKTLASWEELHDAVSKLNAYFGGDKAQGSLNQDDVASIGLGRKGRSYLLILLRLNQLAMETIDGSIFYNLRKNDS
uniref:Spindle and kinetochore-associated protein 3 n=1 Tax=Aegilops tauschii subsp. strangulata TaxID=200361 RepID=A0A453JJS0_AEGTS